MELEISDPKYEGERVNRKEVSFDSENESDLAQGQKIFAGSESDYSEEALSNDQIHDDADFDNIEYELETMQREEKEMMKSISNVAKNDIKKGEHLQNQMVKFQYI